MKRITLSKIRSSLTFISARAAYALIPDPNNQGNRITQQQPETSLQRTLDWIWNDASNLVYLLLGGLAIILFIWAGIQYVSSEGNPDKIKVARQSLINIVLGIILLVAAVFIVRLVLGIPSLFVPGSGR